MVRRSSIDQLFQEIQAIRLRLDEPENITGWNPTPIEVFESKRILLTDQRRIDRITVFPISSMAQNKSIKQVTKKTLHL